MSFFDFIFGNDNKQEKILSESPSKVQPIDILTGVHIGGLPIKAGKKVIVELHNDSIVFKRDGDEVRKILKEDIFSVRYDYEDIYRGSTTTAREEVGLASTLAIMNGDWAAAYFLKPNRTTYETKNNVERVWYLEVDDENGSILIQADEEDLPLFADYCNDMINDSDNIDYFGEYILDDMDEAELKRFCVKMLERNDFTNTVVLPISDDKRVSIVTQRDDVKYAMLCKVSDRFVGGECIDEIESGRKFYHCHVGVVLANTKFSEEAMALAKEHNIVLWDKDNLRQKVDVI